MLRRLALPLLTLAVALPAKEVIWRVQPDQKTKLVYEGETKKFNWQWSRHDPGTVAAFSGEEKAWMKAAFPAGTFRLLKNGDEGFPDEYLVLPDELVLAKDDLFPIPAGGDGAQALALLLRPADGLLSADGKEELNDTVVVRVAPPPATSTPDEATRAQADLDMLLYMENPPAPEPPPPAPPPPEPQPPPPPPARVVRPPVDRTAIPGSLHFLVVKPTASGRAKVIYRSATMGPFPSADILRIRSFDLGAGRGFGVLHHHAVEGSVVPEVRYVLFARGSWGIEKAWETKVLEFPNQPVGRQATRFSFTRADGGYTALLVQRESLASAAEAPDAMRFVPAVGTVDDGQGRGVVDIYELRGGVFKMAGRADRARGNRPVELRKNWPDYLARASRGPSMLLSFGVPGSPYEAYPCPWPGHPSGKVPWVGQDHLFKGQKSLAGEGDLGLATWYLHDTQNLYVIAVMRDDRLVLPGPGQDPSQGDHLQLWLDPRYGDDSLMLELYPGSPPGVGTAARVRSPSAKVGPAPEVRVAARTIEGGYWLEAAIPFSYLAAQGLEPLGSLWGVAINAVDVDAPGGAKAVLSTSKNFAWAKPASFNNLILE